VIGDSGAVDPASEGRSVTLGELARYFVWLGTVGFGGPVVLVERMRRDLQEERRWFTPDEYKEGLALAQLAPDAEFIAEWRGGAAMEAAFKRVREFLRSHTPVDTRSAEASE